MERMLTIQEVASTLGIGRSTLDRWIKLGDFPRPVLKRPRVQRWSQGQLDRWLATSERKARLASR